VVIPFEPQRTEGKPGGSALLDEVIELVRDTFRSLAKAVTNDHLVRVTFPVANTDVQVFHGLTGQPTTWEVVAKDDDVNVWRSSTVNPRPRETIFLRVSAAPATVTVRFS
jgi:hypothetical protein